MKLASSLVLSPLLLLATTVASAPTADAAENSIAGALEKRAVSATVTENNVRYRRCPWPSDSDCEAVGQYHKGQRLTMDCFVFAANVNGNVRWGRISNGFYISDYYLTVHGTRIGCPP